MTLRRAARECLDTLLRRGVRHGAGVTRGGLLLGALLAAGPAARGAVTSDLWSTRDSLALARAAETEAERLLLSTVHQRDPKQVAGAMRRLARLEAPRWQRREALVALCEYFCVTGAADSLARRAGELRELTGEDWRCPLQAAAVQAVSTAAGGPGAWWVQVGAFSSESAAKTALKGLGSAAQRRVLRESPLWKARLGPFASRGEAERAARDWQQAGRLKEFRLVEAAAK